MASDSSRAICHMAVRDVVSIQENMFIELDEESINDFLGLVREIKVHLDEIATI